jgi:hypothetical protein
MAMQARTVAVTRTLVLGALTFAVVLVSLVLGAGSPARAVEAHPEWGSTSAPDGVLRRGCHTYHYNYALTPPQKGDWALEVFIVGPKGKRLASGVMAEGFDPEKGSDSFRICKPTTRPGVFKIKAKFSNLAGDDLVEGYLPVSRFRLRAPG